MENKVLKLIKLYTSNLQRNKQTDLSLENEQLKLAQDIVKLFAIPDVVERSEQFYCTCSRAKGLDHDEEGTTYCISCQKEVQ